MFLQIREARNATPINLVGLLARKVGVTLFGSIVSLIILEDEISRYDKAYVDKKAANFSLDI